MCDLICEQIRRNFERLFGQVYWRHIMMIFQIYMMNLFMKEKKLGDLSSCLVKNYIEFIVVLLINVETPSSPPAIPACTRLSHPSCARAAVRSFA